MIVTVVCFGAMRSYLPPGSSGNVAFVDVPDSATVADVIDRLGAPPKLVHAILVSGERAELSTPVESGTEITLMPPFAGGA